MNWATLWAQGDALNRAVALLLLSMSLVAWALIFYKGLVLWRARKSVPRGIAAVWQSPDAASVPERLRAFDPLALVGGLWHAARPAPGAGTSLEAASSAQASATRRLREALRLASARLQWGQIVLATIGSTAPFVGLLGTVWSIYHALTGLAGASQVGLEQVAGPVGEALVMTALGLLVAIPAVMAYNVLGRMAAAVIAQLDGFAHDLLALPH